jgi:hypothetical protein
MSAVENKIIRAHGDWLIEEVLREWRRLYFINIMFKPLRGAGSALDAQMHDAIINSFYPQLCRHLERHPGRKGRHKYLPHLFLFPDFPVYKTQKQSLRRASLNGGLHYNGVVSISPRSRLKEDLDDHIWRNQSSYYGDKIERVHIKPITYDPYRLMDYGLKTVARGRADYECGIFLPKSLSEMQPAQNMDERTRAIKYIQASDNVSDEVAEEIYRRSRNSCDKNRPE